DSVVISDGGDGYMVGDVITPDMTAATGTSLTITVTSIDETGYSTGLSGVGKITGITYTDSGDFVDADDGDYTFDASTLTGVGSDFVDHVVYEDGGTIPEYVDGT
ncbi:MAG: hypothetical protein GWN01_01025, partial [Nitrosopumilaceae archaeon]|nr:hypothetical protein [Nitrosopumilaceae archaeon]NIX60162.1 hypothetical protein [Nitrosopumilaceae archaeon]